MVISFTINGLPYSVDSNIPIDTSLNTYIRNYAQLKGTKFMCLEGGCGTCIVTVKGIHPVMLEERTWAVNSCLTPIFSCHGLNIITIEGIGNKKDGYHPVQSHLANFNGSQCGYCSPGMVMNMYSLLESKNGSVSMGDVENAFGGNICRCTGYRPILDAFKSLANDADQKLINLCMDIEDLPKVCAKMGNTCSGLCNDSKSNRIRMLFNAKKEWHKVFNLNDLIHVLDTVYNRSYMLVAGNTAHGVYRRNRNIEVFIDIMAVEELRTFSIEDKTLTISGNVTLSETMDILLTASVRSGFEYCKHLQKHIDLIANVPVRNVGTIAGNLSIKHDHNGFPSDLFIILEGVGAKITILENSNKSTNMSIGDYIKFDMKKKLILNIILPSLDPSIYSFRSYKIMPRAQNAHAYVNAAFLLKQIDGKVTSIRICFGGILPEFVHAKNTEQMLIGQNLYTNEVLQRVFETLSSELNPDWILPDASPEYRKNLAISLFYKFVLSTCPADVHVTPEYKSGGDILERDLSSGIQTFDTYQDKWPLTQPVKKYEGNIQTSGEAQYANDIPNQKDELWAAFVLTTRGNGKIAKIDPKEALTIPGVRYFFAAKDIPGKNNFSPKIFVIENPEEIFVGENSNILFHGQPVGMILADSFNLANFATDKVEIIYETNDNVSSEPIMPTIQDVIDANAIERFIESPFKMESKDYGTNATHKFTGHFEMGSQYHFTMEPQTTICIPSDDGMDVYTATQWIDYTQIAISECLNVRENSLNMIVKRIGGGYGAKISRSSQIACACALGCHLTNRPVRFVLTIETNMAAIGKRFACINDYEVEVDDNGKIQKLKNDYLEDAGCSPNENVTISTTPFFQNCYINDGWNVHGKIVITDAPSNTWCRAPGTTEGIAMIENIMEHISRETGKDPVAVRMVNIPDDSPMKTLMKDFLNDIDYYKRKTQIEQYNVNNRWRKRGIGITPMKYEQEYFGSFPVYVAVYHTDGSVVVSHGGIECGQGINTKVAQVTAHALGVPLEMVSIKATNNVIGANSFVTGGSMGSEVVCYAATKACATILERMKPVRDDMKNATFADIANACYNKLIDLTASYMCKTTDLKTYFTWGLSCAEIEIDLLTGNLQLKRVDILEDTGESLSPNVDVGQIEGAFIMGIGYWLTESLVFNRQNGEILTNRTWTYKPPGAKDIPVDFRIKFLQKSSNPFGVLRSKATGEPSLCMSFVVIAALRHAIDSARKDAGESVIWYHLGAPSTPDVCFLQSGNRITDFKL